MNSTIYLDHASTTYVRPEVLEYMLPYFDKDFGNPSSIYSIAQSARQAVDLSRADIAEVLNCDPCEIVFTSGGTESVSLAVKGIAEAKGKGHIITSAVEHHAVLHTVEALEKKGFTATYLPVDKDGLVNPQDVKRAIQKDTILVSIMYANNEIGTIQPVAEIGKICKAQKIPFHTDACQAAGALDLDVNELNVDLMTINSSKIYGPKGVGALYIKKGTEIVPQQLGGGQEHHLRAGTENVPGIVGFAKALLLARAEKGQENERLIKLREQLIAGILKIPKSQLNGHPAIRLPNNVNVSIYGIEGESMLLRLDMEGICASSGSACTSGSLDPSHVLMALGMTHEWAHGSLRLTLGKCNSEADVKKVLKVLPKIVHDLRELSPIRI